MKHGDRCEICEKGSAPYRSHKTSEHEQAMREPPPELGDKPAPRCHVCGETPARLYGLSFDGELSRMQVPLCQAHGDLFCFRHGEFLGELMREKTLPPATCQLTDPSLPNVADGPAFRLAGCVASPIAFAKDWEGRWAWVCRGHLAQMLEAWRLRGS